MTATMTHDASGPRADSDCICDGTGRLVYSDEAFGPYSKPCPDCQEADT